MPEPPRCRRKLRSRVVLPLPRKPVMTVRGIGSCMSQAFQEAIGQRIDPVSGKILGRLPDVSQGGSDLRTTLSIDQQRGLAVPVLHREAQGSKDLRQQGKPPNALTARSEEHTSELQSLMRISYAVFCMKKTQHMERQDNRYLYM